MQTPRVLVTGPVEQLDQWCAAARDAGWEGLAWPLIVIEERAPDEALIPAIAKSLPEQLCITSAHAVHFLEVLSARVPELRTLPCSVVGQRSVGRLRALGFTGPIDWHPSAEVLRAELLAAVPRPARLFWPRGDRSDELARTLREAGLAVDDPIAYTNRPRGATERPPECELVFFASPSAVHAWAELGGAGRVRRALGIGPTTLQALLSGKDLPFFDIISLPEPTSSSFTVALQHIDLRSTP